MPISRRPNTQLIVWYALLSVLIGSQTAACAQTPVVADAQSTTSTTGATGQPAAGASELAAKIDATRQAILNMFTNEIGTVPLKVNVLTALNDDGDTGYIVVLSGQIPTTDIVKQFGSVDPKITCGAISELADKINAAYNNKQNAAAKGQPPRFNRQLVVQIDRKGVTAADDPTSAQISAYFAAKMRTYLQSEIDPKPSKPGIPLDLAAHLPDMLTIQVVQRPQKQYGVIVSGVIPRFGKLTKEGILQYVNDLITQFTTDYNNASKDALTANPDPLAKPAILRSNTNGVVVAESTPAFFEQEAGRLKDLFNTAIADKRVTVLVRPQFDGKKPSFTVTMAGTLDTLEENENLYCVCDTVRQQINTREVSGLYTIAKIKPLGMIVQGRVRSEPWPLVALGGLGAADGFATPPVDAIVSAMNIAFGGSVDKPILSRDANNLWIKAPDQTLLQIKGALAVLDAEPPQVQIDMYAIQMTGTRGIDNERQEKIAKAIRETQQDLASIEDIIGRVVIDKASLLYADPVSRELLGFLRPDLTKIDVNSFVYPFSLDEALILLSTANTRDYLIAEVNKRLVSRKMSPLINLAAILSADTVAAAQDGVQSFLYSLWQYSDFLEFEGVVGTGIPRSMPAGLRTAPQRMAQKGVMIDRMLKQLIDALTMDLQVGYLKPMLDRIQDGRGSNTGVSLAGVVRVVVTDRRQATVIPSLVSWVNTTRPAPFSFNDIANAAIISKPSTPSTITQVANAASSVISTATGQASPPPVFGTGLTAILSGLPPAEAAILAAALLNNVQPVFTKVAPGITVAINPSVTADGAAADLTLDADFGVTTTAPDTTNRKDLWAQAPADAVQSHHVTSHVNVQGFELFDLSSLDIDTQHPHPPFYIPILGRLPLVGSIFQVPVPPHHVKFRSSLLINATIVPRALALVRFYDPSIARARAARISESKDPTDQRVQWRNAARNQLEPDVLQTMKEVDKEAGNE
jgi:hypothetical protein